MSEIDELFKFNCSTLFLLLPLGLNRSKVSEFGFKSAYIRDVSKEVEYSNPVFLLFKPDDNLMFQAFVDSEYVRVNPHTETNDLIEDYDHEGGYVVLLYQFPEEFKDDYERFLHGEYSKFSKKFKSVYPKVMKVKLPDGRVDEVIGTQYKIIHKGNRKLEEEIEKTGDMDIKKELEARLDIILDDDSELWESPGKKDILDIKKVIENDTIAKSTRKVKR